MHKIFLNLILFLLASASAHFLPNIGYQIMNQSSGSNENWNSSVFEAFLDNFNETDNRTFNIRYWTNEKYFKSVNGPIFIYVCGEWTCGPQSDNATPMAFGAQRGALLVAFEHRYYGASQPFNSKEGGWSYENLQWLAVDQAIADLQQFIAMMRSNYGDDRQVVLIGASYSGALVAWYQHIENDATAIWASSAVINAIEYYYDYDAVVYQQVSKSPGCKEAIIVMRNMFEYIYDLNATSPDDMSKAEFMSFVQNVFYSGVQFGLRSQMCDQLVAMSKLGQDEQYSKLLELGKYYGLTPEQQTFKYSRNTTIDENKSQRQWIYQTCTEVGFFTPPNVKNNIASLILNYEYWTEMCQQAFTEDIQPPKVLETNQRYGGLQNNGKNILFFNAQEDPWQYASLRHVPESQRQLNHKAIMINCEGCSHVIDTREPKDTDPSMLTAARKYGMATLGMWLDKDKQKTAKSKELESMNQLLNSADVAAPDEEMMQD